MKYLDKLLVAALVAYTLALNAQNEQAAWNLELNDQQEFVIADNNFEYTYSIYRNADGSGNGGAFDIWISIDNAILMAPNNMEYTLEEGGSIVVRGKKIKLIRMNGNVSNNDIIRGTYKLIAFQEDVMTQGVFAVHKSNSHYSLLISLEDPHRIRIGAGLIADINYKPYLTLSVDGNAYREAGTDYKLSDGASIEIYGKEVGVFYPTSAPDLPPSQVQFGFVGTYTVYNN